MQPPETKVRARALQLLYAWDVSGEPSLDAVVDQCRRAGAPRAGLDRVRDAVARALAHREESDRRVAAAAEHWRPDRVGIVERNIFRLALAELHDGRTPPRVVIDEAVKLAHWFAGPKAPPFVNGVLDRVARDCGWL